jgi:hypothetical protein
MDTGNTGDTVLGTALGGMRAHDTIRRLSLPLKSRRRVLGLLKAPSLRNNVAALGGRSRCVCRKLTRGLAYEYKRCPLLILVLLP